MMSASKEKGKETNQLSSSRRAQIKPHLLQNAGHHSLTRQHKHKLEFSFDFRPTGERNLTNVRKTPQREGELF